MRRALWDVQLLNWAAARGTRPFVWGQTDCVILALEAHDILTGSALADQYRGRWESVFSAKRFMREHDIDIERGLVAAGCEDVAPGYQQRGDFILVPENGWICAHVCMERFAVSSRPLHGVMLFDAAVLCTIDGARILRAG